MDDDAITAKTIELLEEATQLPEGSLKANTEFVGLSGWDSMGMVMFIGLVLEHLQVELTVNDLRESPSVQDMAQRIAGRRP